MAGAVHRHGADRRPHWPLFTLVTGQEAVVVVSLRLLLLVVVAT